MRVYKSEVGPLPLPRYILERITLREVANQSASNGQARKLSKIQKKIWRDSPINFGKVYLKDRVHAFKEAKELNHVWFYSFPPHEYYPRGIIYDHYKVIIYIKTYTHQHHPFEEIFISIDNFHQPFERGNLLTREDRSRLQ